MTPKRDLIFPDDNAAFINGASILSKTMDFWEEFFSLSRGFDKLINVTASAQRKLLHCSLS